jgi:putative membrane protein
VGLLVGLLVLAAGWLTCPVVHPQPGWTSGSWLLPAAGLFPAILCVVAGFIVGSALATWFPVLRLPFVSSREMEEEVARAAQAAFAGSRVRKTAGATGVLLYVSLHERRVVVLPDDGISGVPDDAWATVRDLLIDGLRKGEATPGLVAAIGQCGETLSGPHPRSTDDVEELTNELRFID